MRFTPDSWDSRFGAEVYAEALSRGTLYRELSRRLIEWLAPTPGQTVLDLACGTAIAAAPLYARLGPEGKVVGLDRAQAMLAWARSTTPSFVAQFARVDLSRLPLGDHVADGALCSAAFWHFTRREALLKELARVLRRDARLVLNIPATQLAGVDAGLPAPIMLALARAGEELFGYPPEASGPIVSRAALEHDADTAGWQLRTEQQADHLVAQRELIELLEVPAIGARFYPDEPAELRRQWLDQAIDQVDREERVLVRWHELLLTRTR